LPGWRDGRCDVAPLAFIIVRRRWRHRARCTNRLIFFSAFNQKAPDPVPGLLWLICAVLPQRKTLDRKGAIFRFLIEINVICGYGNLTVIIPKRLPALEADNKKNQGG
jgi:hypothetical protein